MPEKRVLDAEVVETLSEDGSRTGDRLDIADLRRYKFSRGTREVLDSARRPARRLSGRC